MAIAGAWPQRRQAQRDRLLRQRRVVARRPGDEAAVRVALEAQAERARADQLGRGRGAGNAQRQRERIDAIGVAERHLEPARGGLDDAQLDRSRLAGQERIDAQLVVVADRRLQQAGVDAAPRDVLEHLLRARLLDRHRGAQLARRRRGRSRSRPGPGASGNWSLPSRTRLLGLKKTICTRVSAAPPATSTSTCSEASRTGCSAPCTWSIGARQVETGGVTETGSGARSAAPAGRRRGRPSGRRRRRRRGHAGERREKRTAGRHGAISRGRRARARSGTAGETWHGAIRGESAGRTAQT